MKQYDPDNLFKEGEFIVDPLLHKNIGILLSCVESYFSCPCTLKIVSGARTEKSNEEFYKNKYGQTWKNYYNRNSLHIIRLENNNILRAVDIAFILEDGTALSGDAICEVVTRYHLFSSVGIGADYVHVDNLCRIWRYK